MLNSEIAMKAIEARDLLDQFAIDCSLVDPAFKVCDDLVRQVEAMSADITSHFDRIVLESRMRQAIEDALSWHRQLFSDGQRFREAISLVATEVPKRGWYLSGEEPCDVIIRLENCVRNKNLSQLDQEMMNCLPEYRWEALENWLLENRVPKYCVTRVLRFLKHHQEGNFEEATYLGIPVLDEVANHLYHGKAFTTKRSKTRDQSKPELAIRTVNGPLLESFAADFVQAFGSLQEDPDQHSLSDENYWNRHAIVHGQMKRPMGIKDSAKCLMAINFLIFARQDEVKTEAALG